MRNLVTEEEESCRRNISRARKELAGQAEVTGATRSWEEKVKKN